MIDGMVHLYESSGYEISKRVEVTTDVSVEVEDDRRQHVYFLYLFTL